MKRTQLVRVLGLVMVEGALMLSTDSHATAQSTVAAAAASTVAVGDWPGSNRTLAGDRFSPLAEIDREGAKAPTCGTFAL
jgi:glucose dehydrogenase